MRWLLRRPDIGDSGDACWGIPEMQTFGDSGDAMLGDSGDAARASRKVSTIVGRRADQQEVEAAQATVAPCADENSQPAVSIGTFGALTVLATVNCAGGSPLARWLGR